MGAQNISMALKSIKVSRWRSFMTMTGIIIGVVSVITIVSLGEGVKRQVVSQVGRLGDDLVVVRSGNSLVRDKTGGILSVNKLSNLSFENSNLARGDLDIVSKTSEAKHFSPLGLLRSGVSVENVQHNDVTVLASNEQLAELLKLPLAYGAFFREQEVGSHLAVIGKAIAEKIFKENVPIGRTLTIRGEDFVVLGVMADMPTSPFVLEPDLNQSVIIPYPVGEMTNGGVQLVEILATADDGTHTQQLMSALTKSIRKSHKNQDDFSVLRNGESLAVTSDILVTFTAFIAGVFVILFTSFNTSSMGAF